MKKAFTGLLVIITFLTSSLIYSEDKENDALRLKKVKVSMKQAVAEATKARHGDVTKVELEDDDGRIVWNIEIVASKDSKVYDTTIDAISGQLISSKLDREDHEKSNEKDDNEEEDDD